MKSFSILLLIFLLLLSGCSTAEAPAVQIAATTLPVYEFTAFLCRDTGLQVRQLITESVSCLHDYTLQVSQMRLLEAAEVVVLSGAGLEDFMSDALGSPACTIDASQGISLLCAQHSHEDSHGEHEHHREADPHIWLDPENAIQMVKNITDGLSRQYPSFSSQFQASARELTGRLEALRSYGQTTLTELSSRELITFHDGFAYFAEAFDLEILEAVEEESGSETSAAELIALAQLIRRHDLPAIFTERNGSASAASVLSREADIPSFQLDMAMASGSYFTAMYHNIDTLKEALG